MDKKYILEEIKRTSRANGGVPLGVRKFLQETGIKEWDWSKYWPRFGDAVREAGLTPNRMQLAYDEETLIERLIALTRELGKFPVKGELRVKARNNSGFPDESAFKRRLGSKQKRAARVIAYCQEHPGYDDVIALCVPIAETRPEAAKDKDSQTEENFGFVYLIKSGRYYKIGRSNAAGRRERELAIQLPEKANTVHVIRTDDPVGIESYWHKRFEAKHKNGEWFNLNTSDVQAFKRRKFM